MSILLPVYTHISTCKKAHIARKYLSNSILIQFDTHKSKLNGAFELDLGYYL